MIRHPSALLIRYISGDCSAGERVAVEQHLGECPECRQDVEAMTRGHRAISSLELHAPGDFDERLIARLAMAGPTRRKLPGLAAVAAALVLATAVTALWIAQRTRVPHRATVVGSVAPVLLPGHHAYALLFFEDVRWRHALSPELRQARSAAFRTWIRQLEAQGRLLPGGKALAAEGGRTVTTGGRIMRFDEAVPEGESLSGFIIVSAASYEDATSLTLTCPIVTDGKGWVAVRRIAP